MKKERKIKYLAHPVSTEKKRKLQKEGYKILDIRFKPKSEKKPKAKPQAKVEAVEQADKEA